MDVDWTLSIFNTKFHNGYVINSDIHRDQFAEYAGLSPVDIDYAFVEDVIIRNGLRIGNNRVLPINSILQKDSIDVIVGYIEHIKKQGYNSLSLLRIYDDLYDDVFICSKLDRGNAILLKNVLEYYYPGKYECNGETIIFDNDKTCECEIVNILIEEARALSIEEIKEKVRSLSSEDVDRIMENSNQYDIIKVDAKKYMHFDSFNFDQDFLDTLAQLLMDYFKVNDSIDNDELYEELIARLGSKDYLTMYGINSSFCLANIVVHIYPDLSNKFGILSKNSARNRIVDDVMDDFLKYDVITKTIFDTIMKKYHRQQWCYFENILQEYVRIDENTFIKKEKINFPVEEIDQSIARMTIDGYCPISNITTYVGFPSIGYPWNRFVLFSFIYSYSNMFRMICSDSGIPRNFQGIIAVKSKYSSFEQVCAQYLIDSGFTMDQLDNDQLVGEQLKNNGYITRVRKGHYGSIMSIAKSLRAGLDV